VSYPLLNDKGRSPSAIAVLGDRTQDPRDWVATILWDKLLQNGIISWIKFYYGSTAPSGPEPPHYRGFTITLRHSTPGTIPPNEWSTRSRGLDMTTQKRQTYIPPARIEPAVPARYDHMYWGAGWGG